MAYHESAEAMSAVTPPPSADVKYLSNSNGEMTACAAWMSACGKVRLYPPVVTNFVLSVEARTG